MFNFKNEMEKDLSITLQYDHNPEPSSRDPNEVPNSRDSNELWKKYEPESENVRRSLSDLGDIKISKALPILIPLAPVISTLFAFYFEAENINYCFTIPSVYWNVYPNEANKKYTPYLYEKTNVSKCIICNGDSSTFASAEDSVNNLTKGIFGSLLYLFGFWLVYCMFKDASVAIKPLRRDDDYSGHLSLKIKLMAYKIRVKCNKYNSLVFGFFGAILCFAITGTTTLTNPYPKGLLPCPNISANRLFVSGHDFPASQIWFATHFTEFAILMAGFLSLFMALMSDAPGVFIKIRDLVSLATKSIFNKTLLPDFKDIKYELNSEFIYSAIIELGLEEEKDEKNKFLSILAYLDENKKIFEFKPSDSTPSKLENIALDLFGLTPEVHHGLQLDEYIGKNLSEQDIRTFGDIYNKLNDDLSMKIWPNIFVLLLGYLSASFVITFSMVMVKLCFGNSEFLVSNIIPLAVTLIKIYIGTIIYRRRMAAWVVGVNIFYIVVIILSILALFTHIDGEVRQISNTPIMVEMVLVVVSIILVISLWKIERIFRDIQRLKRILSDQGIEVEVEVLRKRKLNEEEKFKYLVRDSISLDTR